MRIGEIDRPTSWPADVKAYIQALAETVPAHVTDGGDLPDEVDLAGRDIELRDLLANRWLRSFHATRLLDYEVEDVQTSGLRALTKSLVEDRQDKALANELITRAEHAALRDSSVFTAGDKWAQYRVGKICLAGNAQPLHDRPHRFQHQLSNWGGEAQYATSAWDHLDSTRVKRLGRPAIVVALLDVSDPRVAVVASHALIYAFVASHRCMANVGSQIDFEADIGGSQIEGIWQPGQQEYDQFKRLPRA
ncbi:hypothetical protein AB0451_34795 [Streptomyces sp. NPDC052000]|uniref:hypothetical protein n=1 Tax=Streptomyces sp. NPDC052000 TaxID=3155676 RepID=UPI00344C7ED8